MEDRTQSLEKKFATVKSELEIRTGHWRKEWQQALKKWIEKIYSYTLTSDKLIVLPVDSYSKRTFFIQTCNSNSSNNDEIHNLSSALDYYENHARGYLDSIPVNLMMETFLYLVNAFNDNDHCDRNNYFATDLANSTHFDIYYQYFWLDDEDKRHHELIRGSLAVDCKVKSTDNWQFVSALQVSWDEKLRPVHYIDEVLKKFKLHQVYRMIQHHFYTRNKEFVKVMEQFASHLSVHWVERMFIGLDLPGEDAVIDLFRAPADSTDSADLVQEREVAKRFNFGENWAKALKNPNFVKLLTSPVQSETAKLVSPVQSETAKLTELSELDVHFIICCQIDAEYDAKELTEKIEIMEKAALKDPTQKSFPTPMDHFYNFDFPHLRGLFSQTVLSRKLEAHALGLEEITKITAGSFAAIAPAALVTIVADYLPVSL